MEVIIYKILSPDMKECYIGSTRRPLNERLYEHKHMNNDTSSKQLIDSYGFDNCIVVILEVCLLEEQKKREQWWLEHSVGAVNNRKVIGNRKEYEKEWCKNNKEKLSEYTKKYYESHKEEVSKKWKEYYLKNREVLNAKRVLRAKALRESKQSTE